MDANEDVDGGLQLKAKPETNPGSITVYYENSDDDDSGWIEELLDDDEVSNDEAAFMQGYILAEREGFD